MCVTIEREEHQRKEALLSDKSWLDDNYCCGGENAYILCGVRVWLFSQEDINRSGWIEAAHMYVYSCQRTEGEEKLLMYFQLSVCHTQSTGKQRGRILVWQFYTGSRRSTSWPDTRTPSSPDRTGYLDTLRPPCSSRCSCRASHRILHIAACVEIREKGRGNAIIYRSTN